MKTSRVRVKESVRGGRVGPVPTYPTLTAAACRVRSAAFPEGNAEGRGSLLLRSHYKTNKQEN